MSTLSSFLIGAPSSGCGKTTLTIGLLRALANRGLKTQPFKCGPDYIDTKYHYIASGRESVNLDLFLSSASHVEQLYQREASQSQVSVVEGAMGLFDGYQKMEGSSAQIAQTLHLPVVLVVNAKAMAYSVAPLLYGFKHFSDRINLVGVIFNCVGSESHYRFLQEACAEVGLKSFGYLPKDTRIAAPSRHLGLTLEEGYPFDALANQAAALVEQYIDVDDLLASTRVTIAPVPTTTASTPSTPSLRIGVAADEAFAFTYPENIAYLRRIGTLSYFSPLRDEILPDVDFIYLPGGYPELYLNALSSNHNMLTQLRHYAERGGKLWAECGGMMYLSESITDSEGNVYPMVGLFKQRATMERMKLTLGYRRFNYNGLSLKGHEFHYSHTEGNLPSVAQQQNAKGDVVATKLVRYKNVIAGYTHLYWGESGNLLDLF